MNKKWFIFGSAMLVLAVAQRYFIARCCHYVPVFDTIDTVFFGLAIIPLIIGTVRLIRTQKQ